MPSRAGSGFGRRCWLAPPASTLALRPQSPHDAHDAHGEEGASEAGAGEDGEDGARDDERDARHDCPRNRNHS